MELLGAKVHPVTSGTRTLKDAVNACMREWTKRMEDSLYVLGSVNIPMELLPPPTQATTAAGSFPSFSRICPLAHRRRPAGHGM